MSGGEKKGEVHHGIDCEQQHAHLTSPHLTCVWRKHQVGKGRKEGFIVKDEGQARQEEA